MYVQDRIILAIPTDFSGVSLGMSGSPVINLHGEFIGYVITSSSGNFKYSVMSRHIAELSAGHIGTRCNIDIGCVVQETRATQELTANQIRRGILGDERTLFHLGHTFLETFMRSRDVHLYLLLGAKSGSARAQYTLGALFSEGKGVGQDSKKAAELYEQAAEQGHAGATYNLGVLFDEGKGVGQDSKRAAELYEQAAEQGHAGAMNNWGIALYEGKGVERDIPQAVIWLKKAAERGECNSQKALSLLYTHGVGVERNEETAAYWLSKCEERISAATEELMDAADRGTVKELRRAIEDGADVNAKRNDAEGATALMWVAYRGEVAMVKELIKAGADLNAVDNQGHSAVDEARSGGHQDIVAILQEAQGGGGGPSASTSGSRSRQQ